MKTLSTILAILAFILLVSTALAPASGREITTNESLLSGIFFIVSFVLAGYYHQDEYFSFGQHSTFLQIVFSFVAAMMTMSFIITFMLTLYTQLGTVVVLNSYWILLASTATGTLGFLYYFTK